MYSGRDYWKNYMHKWFGAELIEKWEKDVVVEQMESGGQTINLEIYDTGKKDAVTIIFSHGIAGYARVLLPFTMPLFEKGYNVVVPDLQGYGYNVGRKGDFEWNIHKQNLLDAVRFAKSKFGGKIILGGASMGGPLAYAAACESDEIEGLICWCLWDFNDREFIINETTTKKFTYLVMPIFNILSRVMGSYRIKTYSLISYETLTDSKDFNYMIKKDPQAGTHITLKGAVSLLSQSKPATVYEDFSKPALVLQPEKDNMTPKQYTEKIYKRLGSLHKKYVEVKNAPHFPTESVYYIQCAEEVDDFLKSIGNMGE